MEKMAIRLSDFFEESGTSFPEFIVILFITHETLRKIDIEKDAVKSTSNTFLNNVNDTM